MNEELLIVLEELLKSDGYIQTNKLAIKTFGLHEAVILGELMSERNYWRINGKLVENEWFYSTRENLEDNTGLTPYYQRLALETFEKLGIIESKQIGIPAKKYYRIIDNNLLKELSACRKSLLRLEENPFNDKNEEALTENNNKEKRINNKNNKKTPVPASSLELSSKRNFRRDTDSLIDTLSSGRDIDKQTKKKKEKIPVNVECLEEIERDSYGFDSTTKQLLIQYIAFVTEVGDQRRVKNLGMWQKKLSTLLELSNNDNILMQKIIKQSLDNKWYKFVEYEEVKKKTSYNTNRATNDGLIMQILSPDEAQAELERKVASGVKGY